MLTHTVQEYLISGKISLATDVAYILNGGVPGRVREST